MHMANELLSLPVAASGLGLAGAGIGIVCRKARGILTAQKLAVMGVMGAFVFAAQMVNFQLPGMPGTSGHMVGSVLLAIMLGPSLASIVISSIVIVQCLLFQDGGLLALGCNIINMALVPSFIGYYVYGFLSGGRLSALRKYIATIAACVVAVEAGAILVCIEATASGVLLVPFRVFSVTMLGVHFLVGLMEGIITSAVLAYLVQVRPDIVAAAGDGRARMSFRAAMITLVVFALVTAAGLSLLASGFPDGLEWSYAERPDQPEFKPAVANNSNAIVAVDEVQSKYTLMPDYSRRLYPMGKTAEMETTNTVSRGWTSLAGVLGSFVTMIIVWVVALILRKRQVSQCITHT